MKAPPALAFVFAVVVRDGVDHALRDLRAARAVEEGDGPAVLLAGEGRELGAQGIDIERGHRSSGGSVARTASVPDRRDRRMAD